MKLQKIVVFLKIASMTKPSLSIPSDRGTNMNISYAMQSDGEVLKGNSRTTCSARIKDSHRLVGEIAVASESWRSSRRSE